MFNQLFRSSYYVTKHINTPLLEERLNYLQYWHEAGKAHSTLTTIAQYLVRIVEYLQLDTTDIVTIEEVEVAADLWARYQSNNPQKKAAFSKTGKKRFIWYATHWLAKLCRLKRPVKTVIPVFQKIFVQSHTIARHSTAPLVEERVMYLQYWSDCGAVTSTIRIIAQYLLIIIQFLDFYQVRIVTLSEIEEAAVRWRRTRDPQNIHKKSKYSKFAKRQFIRNAARWFKMLGCLQETKQPISFEEYLNQYISYMRQEQGLSECTILSRFYQLRIFLTSIEQKQQEFTKLTPLIVDEIIIGKHDIDHHSRRTVQLYASILRSFLRYAEDQGWCPKHLASTIKAPRVYRDESLPSAPYWSDVKRLLANSVSDSLVDIRDYAILMLLSVYGMRCSEVTHLRLEDIDWENELIHLQRAKRCKPQTFPLSKTVGEAILRYLTLVRPKLRTSREIFLSMYVPYKLLSSAAVYQIVSKRLKKLNITIKHYGPHALRHACATHLINEGISLKEISDHLGHRTLDTTRIYAKVDLTTLRKVAEFDMGGLL
ncbi:tyrosine-type recombinase/integrase (plasmid) [Candidatus Megaera polyxenophila]|uniref:tyrosine-type recombinase/integrase n=1 Tax=Candidatus Megaera polyxenophila TaxID=988779 RepID=UPI00249EBD7E|nr:tyrosine-type recombinase/integrase [Candidatus Megaera polyxenophila]WHA05854.1 tyrosine-type recombinase/integrase [Candidatus Megaera polyxenophila]WHA07716.1 tyrosine-type recombinase/integrase [Candidatus Megaera polyxenophila]